MSSQSLNQAALPVSPELYDRLRSLAAAWLDRERTDHTHQPTSLANEAYIRLAPNAPSGADLLPLAAHVMRQVLVDHARRRNAAKRGGDWRRVRLDDTPADDASPDDLLAVHDALERLDRLDPQLARIVELRFFGGLSESETAACLDVSTRTVSRAWRVARMFLARHLHEPAP
jgi:RNA polymerase sigma factor (TIGR02999 family)